MHHPLTIKQLRIYGQYRGDATHVTSRDEALMKGAWSVINELVLAIHLVRSGNASEEFQLRTWETVSTSCDSQESVDALISLSDRLSE